MSSGHAPARPCEAREHYFSTPNLATNRRKRREWGERGTANANAGWAVSCDQIDPPRNGRGRLFTAQYILWILTNTSAVPVPGALYSTRENIQKDADADAVDSPTPVSLTTPRWNSFTSSTQPAGLGFWVICTRFGHFQFHFQHASSIPFSRPSWPRPVFADRIWDGCTGENRENHHPDGKWTADCRTRPSLQFEVRSAS